MAGFIYFLPGETNFQESLLRKYGIEHIRDLGDSLLGQGVINGPDNQPGWLVGNASAGLTQHDVRWSDKLDWRPFPKSQAEGVERPALCCWKRDAMPRPADLARRKQLTGEVLTLADNQCWLVPNARRWADDCFMVAVPRSVDIDNETGSFVYGEVLPAYRKIWEHANCYWQNMVEASRLATPGEPAAFAIDNPIQLIVDALAANYRVSARELGILGAIDDQMVGMVADVLIDRDGMNLLEKKTDDATGNG